MIMDTAYINPAGNYPNPVDIEKTMLYSYSLLGWQKPVETVTPMFPLDYKKMSVVNILFPERKNGDFLPLKLKMNADFLSDFQEQIFSQDKDLSQKVARLIDNIGIRLYKKLTQQQIMLMVRTAGVIEFDKSIDITSTYNYIKTYKP